MELVATWVTALYQYRTVADSNSAGNSASLQRVCESAPNLVIILEDGVIR